MDREGYIPYQTSSFIDNILDILSESDLQRRREGHSAVGNTEKYFRMFQYELIYQQEGNGPLCKYIEPSIIRRLAFLIGEFCLSITKYGWWNPAYFDALIAELHLVQMQLEAKEITVPKVPVEAQQFYGKSLQY